MTTITKTCREFITDINNLIDRIKNDKKNTNRNTKKQKTENIINRRGRKKFGLHINERGSDSEMEHDCNESETDDL